MRYISCDKLDRIKLFCNLSGKDKSHNKKMPKLKSNCTTITVQTRLPQSRISSIEKNLNVFKKERNINENEALNEAIISQMKM